MKKRFRNQPKYYLQEAEALGSKPYISGLNCYIIQGRAEQTRWQGEVGSGQVSTALSSPVPHTHSTAWAPRGCRRQPQRQRIPASPPSLPWLKGSMGDFLLYAIKSMTPTAVPENEPMDITHSDNGFYVVLPANSFCIYTNDNVFKYRQPTQNKATMASDFTGMC